MKWTGTGLCLIGIALTSLNIYPLNLWFGLVGSGLFHIPKLLVLSYMQLCHHYHLYLQKYILIANNEHLCK